MNFEGKIIAEIVFFTKLDYLEYVQNEREQSIKNRRKNANRRKTQKMMKFQIVFGRILIIFAVINSSDLREFDKIFTSDTNDNCIRLADPIPVQ